MIPKKTLPKVTFVPLFPFSSSLTLFFSPQSALLAPSSNCKLFDHTVGSLDVAHFSPNSLLSSMVYSHVSLPLFPHLVHFPHSHVFFFFSLSIPPHAASCLCLILASGCLPESMHGSKKVCLSTSSSISRICLSPTEVLCFEISSLLSFLSLSLPLSLRFFFRHRCFP